MTEALALGFSLGLSAGITPGPLVALIVQRSIQCGLRAGVRVAVAPLLSDPPIVALAIAFAGAVPERGLTALQIAGGLFVLWLAVDAWRRAGSPAADAGGTPPRNLRDGVLVNLLNPHPYLFWATVGGPWVVESWHRSPPAAVGFLVVFYVLLIGGKLGLAVLVARSHGKSARLQRTAARGTALLLAAAGLYLLITAGR